MHTGQQILDQESNRGLSEAIVGPDNEAVKERNNLENHSAGSNINNGFYSQEYSTMEMLRFDYKAIKTTSNTS